MCDCMHSLTIQRRPYIGKWRSSNNPECIRSKIVCSTSLRYWHPHQYFSNFYKCQIRRHWQIGRQFISILERRLPRHFMEWSKLQTNESRRFCLCFIWKSWQNIDNNLLQSKNQKITQCIERKSINYRLRWWQRSIYQHPNCQIHKIQNKNWNDHRTDSYTENMRWKHQTTSDCY